MSTARDDVRREIFLTEWAQAAKDLYERDGRCTDPKVKNGGHRIKNNLLLIAAIGEIRDCYFGLLEEKLQALLERPQVEEHVHQVDIKMADHFYTSLQRLRTNDYGFDTEEKRTIRAEYLKDHSALDEEKATALDSHESQSLIGSIIGRAVSSYMPLVPPRRGVDHFLVPSAITHPDEIGAREPWSCREKLRETAAASNDPHTL